MIAPRPWYMVHSRADKGPFTNYVQKIFDIFDPPIHPLCHHGYITGKSLSEALLFAEHWENMLCTKIVQNVGNNFCIQHIPPGLSLEFSCIELVIQ